MFNYIYYELPRNIVVEVEGLLLHEGRTDITLHSGGNKMVPLVLKSSANKPTTSGFLLTVEEKSLLDRKSPTLFEGFADIIHVIRSADDLKRVLEEEHDFTFGASEEPTASNEHGSNDGTESVAVRSGDGRGKPHLYGASSYGATPQNPQVGQTNFGTTVDGSWVGEHQPTSRKVETPEPERVSSTSTEASVETPVDPMVSLFGMTVEEELEALRAENDQLKASGGAGVSSEEVNTLKAQVSNLEERLSTEQESNERLKGYVADTEETLKQRNLAYSRLEVEFENYKESQAGVSVKELTPLRVPHNVEFYVTASSLGVAPSYQYLLCNSPHRLLVDLAQESFMDTLVRLKRRTRVTKWLLEGQNIRALYTPYETYTENQLLVSEGLELLTSPTVVYPEGMLEEVDWDRKLEELARLGSKVSVYLGLESSEGVSEFMKRLDGPVKVLRGGNALEERAWKRIVRHHEGNVEEVQF